MKPEFRDDLNSICCGEITLESSNISIDKLIIKLKAMLKDKDIREYLDLLKIKRFTGGVDYLG